MKYPWIFEFLYTEIFVFGQMFGDFTEFSVEFSRRESWQYFAALCQCQPIYELSPIGKGKIARVGIANQGKKRVCHFCP